MSFTIISLNTIIITLTLYSNTLMTQTVINNILGLLSDSQLFALPSPTNAADIVLTLKDKR